MWPNLCFTHSLLLVSGIFAPCWVNFPSKERETNPQIRCFGFSMDEHTVDGEIRLSPVDRWRHPMILLGFQPSVSVVPLIRNLTMANRSGHLRLPKALLPVPAWHLAVSWSCTIGRPTPMRFWAPKRSPWRIHSLW